MSSIRELYQYLIEMKKSRIYYLVDKLIHLVLTLPVSAATTKRIFSTMKFLKARLCEKMEDEFFADSSIVYVERKITEAFSLDFILDKFVSLKNIIYNFNFQL